MYLQQTSVSTPSADSSLSDIGLGAAETTEDTSDKNQFLELMIAQLENQNPLDPQEGGEFLAQLAQFSMNDGIERLNESVTTIQTNFRSSQALQAASLVGRSVAVTSSEFYSSGSGVDGSIELENSTSNVRIEITNTAGEIIQEYDLGTTAAGTKAFSWDGTDSAGTLVGAGTYQVNAYAKTDEGEEQLETEIVMNVDSVTIGDDGGVELNINGYDGSMALENVRQIR
ncbi:MAG: flagellar hook assembly protein FlgD [Pseudomonadota bacterium]|nr:flagellar hook assembly protein FlgD [Pseudomonadota bacterium]